MRSELEKIAQEDREFREQAENELLEEPDDGTPATMAAPTSPPTVPQPRLSFSRHLQTQSSADDLDNLSPSYFVGVMSRQEAGVSLRDWRWGRGDCGGC